MELREPRLTEGERQPASSAVPVAVPCPAWCTDTSFHSHFDLGDGDDLEELPRWPDEPTVLEVLDAAEVGGPWAVMLGELWFAGYAADGTRCWGNFEDAVTFCELTTATAWVATFRADPPAPWLTDARVVVLPEAV